MALLQNVWHGYNHVISDLADHRTKDWWLVESPGPIVTILASYLFFCGYAGPNYMRDRKPYNLKHVIAAYNLFQVLFSIFLTYRGIEFIIATDYKFKCHSIDYSENGVRWAANVWWYYIAKITELLDTVFFVLRKKNNQISFLHLYHHTLMPFLSWFGSKYTPVYCFVWACMFLSVWSLSARPSKITSATLPPTGLVLQYAEAGTCGQSIAEGTINAFIHIVMYGYYFVSGLGPQYQKYLWWKKYLTSLQLVQFCIVLYLNVIGLFAQNCNYPKYLNVFVIINCVAFLYMFGRFYYGSYVKNKITQKRGQQEQSEIHSEFKKEK